MKAGICGNNLVVLGETDNGKELKSLVGGTWKKVKTFSKNASMVSDGNVVCVTDGGNVYTSSDLTNWNSAYANVKTVLGVCGKELFAMSNANEIMVSFDEGFSWKVDAIDEDAKLLPSSNFNLIAGNTKTNSDIKRAFLIGNSTADNTNAVVWIKIIEEDPAKDIPWMYQEFKRINYYTLPKMNNLSVIPYADGMIAIGGKYEKMYYSIDSGITWKNDKRFILPEGFSAETASMAVDANNYIWIVCTGTGQIWRGRLNELGW